MDFSSALVKIYRLHQQLKYFVVNKISTDSLWRNTRVSSGVCMQDSSHAGDGTLDYEFRCLKYCLMYNFSLLSVHFHFS